MKCQDILPRLSEYIDGDLPDNERSRIARHIRSCARCRAVLRTLQKTIVLSREWFGAEEQPPPEITSHISLTIRIQYQPCLPAPASETPALPSASNVAEEKKMKGGETMANNLVRWDPMTDLLGVKADFDRLLDRVVGRDAWMEGVWNPPVDIFEDAEAITVKVAVPGISKENVNITLSGDTLTISGKTAEEKETRKGEYYRKEIRSGAFSRSFTLPCPIQRDKVKASQKDGILEIVLPKAEEAKLREVKIDVK